MKKLFSVILICVIIVVSASFDNAFAAEITKAGDLQKEINTSSEIVIDTIKISDVNNPHHMFHADYNPPTYTIPADAKYTVGARWYSSDGYWMTGGVLVTGSKYFAVFTIRPHDGYKFTRDTLKNVTINGEEPYSKKIDDYGWIECRILLEAKEHIQGEVLIENNVDSDCTNAGAYDTVVCCKLCDKEISRDTIVVPAKGHVEGEVVVENEEAPDCKKDGSYDNVVYCAVCDKELSRETIVVPAIGFRSTTIGGNYTSFNGDADEVSIVLYEENSQTAVQTLVKTADNGTYLFENVYDGSYKILISKNNHATRSYTVTIADGEAVILDLKIYLKGDINGDGKVIITDYTAILRHVKKTDLLDGYKFACADVDENGKVVITDYTAVLKHVKKITALW